MLAGQHFRVVVLMAVFNTSIKSAMRSTGVPRSLDPPPRKTLQ